MSTRTFGYGVIAVVVWGALSFGAVYPWGYWPLAAACAGLGAWAVAHGRGWRKLRSTTLAIGLGAVAVAIGLQLVPLPYAAFARLSPAADRFLDRYDLAYQFQKPGWHALSISPADTLTVLALFAALSLLLLGLLEVLGRLRLAWVVSRLVIFGVAMAVFGVVQHAFDIPNQPRVYGFWKPEYGGGPFGPFINRNHFAGWMIMAVPVGFGYVAALVQASWRAQGSGWKRWLLWLARPEASRVALMGFGVIAMATSLVLTQSRSGIVGFMLAIGVLTYFIVRQGSRRLGRVLTIVAAAGLIGIALGWAGIRTTLGRFSHSSYDVSLSGRVGAWRDTQRIIGDFPVFGTGLGTYGIAMLVYQTGARDQIFIQAHNDYLQLAAEGGLLVALPAVAVITIVAGGIRRRFTQDDDLLTGWIRAGAVAGLVGIAAQSFVDFSLQMPGNTVLLVVLLGLALQPPQRHTADAHRM
jgi:O-Antigen ligase